MKPTGDRKRILDTTKAKKLGFEPETSLSEGIAKTIRWYSSNRKFLNGKFNAFN